MTPERAVKVLRCILNAAEEHVPPGVKRSPDRVVSLALQYGRRADVTEDEIRAALRVPVLQALQINAE